MDAWLYVCWLRYLFVVVFIVLVILVNCVLLLALGVLVFELLLCFVRFLGVCWLVFVLVD